MQWAAKKIKFVTLLTKWLQEICMMQKKSVKGIRLVTCFMMFAATEMSFGIARIQRL